MDIVELLKDYIKPELLVVTIVLYFLGIALKNSETINDKYIPIILGVCGIFIAFLYVFATVTITNFQSVLMIIFTALVQGILVAGASVYVNQLIKQIKKEE